MKSLPPGSRSNRVRFTRGLLATLVAASGLAFVVGAPSGAQAADPTIEGAPCALGEGVTVVIDYTDEPGATDLEIGCAPGEQASGFAALTAAGFAHEAEGGFLCQIEGVPAAGTPCFPQGYWSYWHQAADGTWSFSPVGLGGGPARIDSIMGLSWVANWQTGSSLPPRTVIELVEEPPASTTSTTSTTTSIPGSTTTTTVPGGEGDGCAITRTATEGLEAALDWLGCELEANGHAMPGFGGAPSWGLTLDVILAYATYGRADHPAAVQAFANFEASINSYVTGADFGSPDDIYAGALGKALLTVATMGGDHNDFGGLDLDDALLERMQTEGDDAGRLSDVSEWGDYSNGLGQALGMLGLARTSGVPALTVDFLLDQQCPAGGFRGDYSVTGGCTTDDNADIDYTAVAILALMEAPRSTQVQEALDSAKAWLLSRQQPSGAFTGTGDTAVENTNSTGLVAMALRALGENGAADAAQAYVESAQITGDSSAPGADRGAGQAGENIGAIAYDPATLAEAIAAGISEGGLQQWHIATSQAVYAFGAVTFGMVDVPVETPEETTTTTTTPVGETVPEGAGQPIDGARSGGGAGAGGGSGSLPRTGAESQTLVYWAMGLLVVGVAGVAAERARRRRLMEAEVG